MSALEALEVFKTDALERLEENERVIAAQNKHIAILEMHLGKCRDSAYQMYFATTGVLPAFTAREAKPAKPKKAKK